MVSTYLSYNLVNRDMKAQLDRVAKQPEVARDQQYYDANIGTVKTSDEFVDNYRLFSYAMKAYGLEDMTYAKAFMKKVLDSDLNDDNSFANKLTDDRFRKFAEAFQFKSSETAATQTSSQTDDVIDHYKQTIQDQADAVDAANTEFKAGIANVKSVDDLLNNEDLRTYTLKAFGVDSPYWSKDFLTKVLTSDVNDPQSYVNTLTMSNKSNYKALAAAFNFNASGTLDTGVTAQTADQTTSTVEAYTFTVPTRLTPAGAALNKTYFESHIGSITSVDQLVNDSRMFDYVKTAYGLDKVSLKSELKNILTSDLSDPNNYATTFGGSDYEAVTKAFSFNPDGTVNGASPQTTAQTTQTSSFYMARYDDEDDAADEDLYTYYKTNIATMNSVKDIEGTGKLYNFVLTAFGLDPTTTTQKQFEQIVESDLSDPKSFANAQKDKRYTDMAADFNFDAKGNKTAPLLAQSQQTMQQIASEYVVRKTRFGHDDQKDQATKDASAYTTAMQNVKTVKDFLSNRKLVDFVLQSKGLDPKDVTDDFMKQLFNSDLTDPKSFANQQTDHNFIDIVTSFNFDAKGNIGQRNTSIQDRHGIENTDYKFLQQTLETDTGEDAPGAQLALYFKRMLPSINSAYDILGDTALLEVFRTTFSLPAEMSTMDIDKQKALIDKNLNLEDLQDPAKLEKFVSRFTAMYDLANETDTDPILTLFGSSSGGVSADTLLSIAQLKSG
jgi:hypothetical protein